MEQIIDPYDLLCDIDEAHGRALAESFRYYEYYYIRKMMTVHFLSAVCSEEPTYATAVLTIVSMKIQRTAIVPYCLVVVEVSAVFAAMKLLTSLVTAEPLYGFKSPLRFVWLIFGFY